MGDVRDRDDVDGILASTEYDGSPRAPGGLLENVAPELCEQCGADDGPFDTRCVAEGLLAATFVTFIVSIAILPSIDPLTLGRSVGLALVIAVFAPLGDLAESLMKRDLGVKDMGSVLPGHGGIMDRIDSALFVLPAAFYFLRLIF